MRPNAQAAVRFRATDFLILSLLTYAFFLYIKAFVPIEVKL